MWDKRKENTFIYDITVKKVKHMSFALRGNKILPWAETLKL